MEQQQLTPVGRAYMEEAIGQTIQTALWPHVGTGPGCGTWNVRLWYQGWFYTVRVQLILAGRVLLHPECVRTDTKPAAEHPFRVDWLPWGCETPDEIRQWARTVLPERVLRAALELVREAIESVG